MFVCIVMLKQAYGDMDQREHSRLNPKESEASSFVSIRQTGFLKRE